jgi:hypothetical protein
MCAEGSELLNSPARTKTPLMHEAMTHPITTVARYLIGTSLGVTCVMPVLADSEMNFSGFLAGEARLFTQTPQFSGQLDRNEYSLALQPELRYEFNDQRVTLVPFYREDSLDEERSHFDLREFNWRKAGDDWDLLVGLGRVFWGVTESRHLVDVINQTDLVENIDQEDKLGQPMVNLALLQDWGTVGLFVLPGFRERTFPGVRGRLRTPLPVDTDNPVYESSAEDSHVDAAVRYSHVIDDWDVGIYYFYGTGREPSFIGNGDGTRLLPVYSIINQVGTDIQWTHEAWLWKFEGIVREGQGETFGALVAGFEYTFYQIAETALDLGILAEYLHDGRDETAPPVLFDDDIFLGARLAFNDTADTAVLGGIIFDPSTTEKFFSLEAERRLTDHITTELEIRVFSDEPADRLLSSFSRDDYIQLTMAYYF